MGTEESSDALHRRLERLTSLDAGEPDAAGESPDLAAVRSDVLALRADLGSVCSELAATRSELSRLGSSLTGSVAASRSETGALGRRMTDLTLLLRTGGAAGSDSLAALVDTSAAIESHLAFLEDSLDGMSERIEALARDGASRTTGKLTHREACFAALTARLDGLVEQVGPSSATQLAAMGEHLLAALAAGFAGLEARLADAPTGQVTATAPDVLAEPAGASGLPEPALPTTQVVAPPRPAAGPTWASRAEADLATAPDEAPRGPGFFRRHRS